MQSTVNLFGPPADVVGVLHAALWVARDYPGMAETVQKNAEPPRGRLCL